MPQSEDIIWNTITDSAKTRFDYETFESTVSEYDERIAENMLFMTLLGHAQDKGAESIASELSMKLLLIGLGGANDEIKEFVGARLTDLSIEITATKLALALTQMGHQTPEILIQVKSVLSRSNQSASKESPSPTAREADPQLSDACRSCVGDTLALRFNYGMGWTQVTAGECSEYSSIFETSGLEGLEVEVIPNEFFGQKGVITRGFMGKISQGDHRFSSFNVVAVPYRSGTEFNFTDNACPEWKIWLSEKPLPVPTKSFRQLTRGGNLVAGYASIYDGAYCESLKPER
jgi:hypothetical protein